MKSFKKIILFVIFAFVLLSCSGTSYHKDKLSDELKSLVKKELGIDSTVVIIQNTLYLDIELDSVAKKQDEIKSSFDLVSEAFSAMTRVVLSSDSDIKFVIVSAYPKDKSILFRMGQNIDDFKAFYYMRISRDDFLSRSMIEIEGPQTAKFSIADKRDISIDEFAGRLIVSYIMNDIRSNPLFAASVSNVNLRFLKVETRTLYLSANIDIISEAREVLQLSLQQETANFLSKYEDANIRFVKVIGNKNSQILDLSIAPIAKQGGANK
ncbi:MAG: hypothetical protein LBN20_00270 [Endomicrobium sp.]|jgi:hypothetical protein|nr:hypothetical protein [Endomicrobium sp.]